MNHIRLILLSFLIFIGALSNAQVCTPQNYQFYSKCCGIGIQNLYINGKQLFDSSNYSANSNYTDNYNDTSATTTAGNTYTMRINTQNYTAAICMWVDWNKNDTFESQEIEYSNSFVNPGSNTFNFTPKACNDSFRVRVLADYYYYYFSGTAAFDPCMLYYGDFYDFKLFTKSSASNDIALINISSNDILNQGYNKVSIDLRNFGDTTIDSARVYYQVNNGNTLSEDITGINLAACNTYNYTFSDSFAASNGLYKIKSWVKYPNGVNPDATVSNDTMVQLACVALNGQYTIDISQNTGGSNFKTFTDAFTILNKCGINGPVVFTVAPGNYKDSVFLSNVNGSSSTNTITFNGVDTSNRILTVYNADIISLKDCQYINFKNLSFRPVNSGSNGINLDGTCEYINIDSCSFRSSNGGQSGVYVIASYYNNQYYPANYISVTNSVFSKFSYGIYLQGGYNKKGTNNVVANNTVKNCSFSIMTYYQDSLNVYNNISKDASSYGMYAYMVDNSNIYNNHLSGNNYNSMVIYDCSSSKIYNNMFSGETNCSYNMQISYSQDCQVAHNTAYHSATSGYNYYVIGSTNIDFRNNISYTSGTSSYNLYAPAANQFSALDYNQYYNGGSSSYVYLGGDYANFAALKGQLGFNLYSSGAKPNFVSTTVPRNLHLVTNLAPIYGDATVGLTTDFDGDTRCSKAPTVGADESKYTQGKPVSDFVKVDTAFINSPVIFVNKGAFNEGKWFEWFVDTATVPTSTVLDLSHVFNANGTYDVTLRTYNCSQSADTTKKIVIVTPSTPPTTDFVSNITILDPLESIKLTDKSKGGATSWNWTVAGGSNQGQGIDFDYINGTDSTSQNPEITFYIGGLYDICLTTDNSAGSNTLCKSAYIKVYAVASMCASTVVTDMFGHFYDEGGKANNYPYANNKSCNLLISPCSGQITLTFSKANFDSSIANLKIYDGVSSAGKLLNPGGANGNGRYPKVGSTFVAKSGNMYIDWSSVYGSYPGWEATWTTTYQYIPKAPATIKTTDTAFVNSTHSFEPKFYKDGVQYDWDLDNDGTLDNQGRYIDFVYTNTGNYLAVCYATSCSGVDTAYYNVVVVNPSVAPNPVNFALDPTAGYACQIKPQSSYVMEVGISALLYDKSGNGPTSWEWNIVNSTGNYTWDNGNNIQNPTLTLIDTGWYSIELKVTNGVGTTTKVFNKVIRAVDAHCQPSVTNAATDYGITRFAFNDIVNKSNYNEYYIDNSSTYNTCVESGNKYTVTVNRQTNTSNCKVGVWIDYNQDGDFNDAGELVKINNNLSTTTYTDSTIKIPALSSKVLFGRTIMRVGIVPTGTPFYICGNNNMGEYEDYGIFITDDRTAPVITRIGADTVTSEIGLTYQDKGAKAVDNLDGIIAYTVSGSINNQTAGYYTIRYDAIDNAGNEAIPVYRTVNITGDNSAPVISIIGSNPYFHDVNTTYNDQGATAYDSAEGVINNVYATSNVNANVLGTYQVWYKASDSKGNTDSVYRSVIVVDSLPPMITLLGKDTMNITVNTGYTEPGYTVVDNYDPNPIVTITPAVIDTTKIQNILVTYKAVDSKGNKSEKYRWLFFADDLAPVVKLNGADTVYVEVKTAYNELGATVKDNFDPNPVFNITGGPVNTSVLGTTIIYYAANDQSGNTTVEKRYVIVRKTSKPIINLVGNNSISLFTQQTYTEQGVNFSDAFYIDSELRPNLKTGTDFPNPSAVPGNFRTWFHVVDPSGNASDTAYRQIIVNASGISKANSNSQLQVFPNPTSNILFIDGMQAGKNTIQVFDLNGKALLIQNTNATLTQLSTENLPAGVYILKTTNGDQINVNRFEVIK